MTAQHAKADNLPELDTDELALVSGGTDLGANVLEKVARPGQLGWMNLETIWHSHDQYFTVGSKHPGDPED